VVYEIVICWDWCGWGGQERAGRNESTAAGAGSNCCCKSNIREIANGWDGVDKRLIGWLHGDLKWYRCPVSAEQALASVSTREHM
jgi:hypothetical protein